MAHPTRMTTVLGIDPGSQVTGYAFLRQNSDRSTTVLECGAIRPPRGAELAERLLYIADSLDSKISTHCPDMLCMESAFVSLNARSALVLGHVRGAVMVLSARHGLQFREISPSEVKRSVTGSGAADKEQVASMVCRLLRIARPDGPADITDALAIAWSHLGIMPAVPVMKRPTPTVAKKSIPTRTTTPSIPSSHHIATALPAGTDAQAFLLAHGRKRHKRR